MVKREDLKHVATAVLQKKHKLFRIAFVILVVLVLLMVSISFFNWKANGLNATAILPVFFLPMVIINYLSFKRIREELKTRTL